MRLLLALRGPPEKGQGEGKEGVLLVDPNHKHEDGFTPAFRAAWGREQRHTDTLKVGV